MKTMTRIMMLMLTAVVVFGFVSCSSNDDNKEQQNIVSEYSYNDNLVAQTKAKSGNTKAVLLVAFGSTWTNAFDAFDNTVAAYQKAFPGYDVYLSYSSDICINRAAAAEHGVERDFYEPRYLLHAIGAAKYSEIRVQSLQVIPGEEFSNVVAAVKKFMNNGYISTAHLDDEYLKDLNDNEAIYFGMPLLYSAEGTGTDNDVETVAKNLDGVFHSYVEQGIVAFMGHGNPDTYDTFKANVRYTQLEEALQKIDPNYFVGTVDMTGNKKADVWNRAKSKATSKSSTITFQALMSIAGDHAHNDMIGEGDEYWDDDDPTSDDNSWYEYFKNIAFFNKENTTINGNAEPIGLLEIPSILNVWIEHTKDAQPFEDAYHSMYPEE